MTKKPFFKGNPVEWRGEGIYTLFLKKDIPFSDRVWEKIDNLETAEVYLHIHRNHTYSLREENLYDPEEEFEPCKHVGFENKRVCGSCGQLLR